MKLVKVKTIRYLLEGAIFIAVLFNFTLAQAQYSAGGLVALTNESRSQNGLGTLSTNSALATAAYNKAKDMFEDNYFAHTSPDGKTPWDFIKEAGYTYSYAGENLAIGYADADELFDAWMNSPTHRENILNSNFREIGIAVLSGTFEGSQTLIAVQEFGTPLSAEQVASEVSADPTTSPNVKSFQIIKEKTGFSPQTVFANEPITLTVTLTGEVKTLEAKIFDQNYNLLETGSLMGQEQKTYTLAPKISQVGAAEVSIVATDKAGLSENLSLGQLTVKPTVIAKEGEPVRENPWPLYGFASVGLVALVGLIYFFWRSNRFQAMLTAWRI